MRNLYLCLVAIALGSLLLTQSARGTGFISTHQILGKDDLQFIEELEALDPQMYEWTRAVAKADLGSSGCTAFRLAENLFMTNHHCYDGSYCSSTRFILGYEKHLPESQRVTLQCKRVISYDPGLDYALYETHPPSKDQPLDDFPSFTLSRTMPPTDTPLLVPGFPCCETYKRFEATDACRLLDPGGSSGWSPLKHGCDTVSGSSGSPIVNRENGEVIGIHWGHTLGNHNNGTQMYKVLDDIRRKAPEVYEQLSVSR